MELRLVGSRPISEAAVLLTGGAAGQDHLTIDATALTFAGPLDLAGIVAIARWAADNHLSLTFKLPRNPNVAAYLQRMNVLLHLPPRVQVLGSVPPESRSDLRGKLLEVTLLDAKNATSISEGLGPMIVSFYKDQRAEGGAAVFAACGELLTNVVDHGSSASGAVVAAQMHTGATTEGPRLEFAVCDSGIGVLASLRKNPQFTRQARDEFAIRLALRRGVSAVADDRYRGKGLFDVVNLPREHGRVEFQMRSGRGQVKVFGTPDLQPHQLATSRPDQTFGTWASLTHWMQVQE